MTEKQRKILLVTFRVCIGLNIVCGIALCFTRNFHAALWICMASYWMWRNDALLRENEKLRQDKRDLAVLIYGQHAFMKREIQKAREAQKGNEDDRQSQSHGS